MTSRIRLVVILTCLIGLCWLVSQWSFRNHTRSEESLAIARNLPEAAPPEVQSSGELPQEVHRYQAAESPTQASSQASAEVPSEVAALLEKTGEDPERFWEQQRYAQTAMEYTATSRAYQLAQHIDRLRRKPGSIAERLAKGLAAGGTNASPVVMEQLEQTIAQFLEAWDREYLDANGRHGLLQPESDESFSAQGLRFKAFTAMWTDMDQWLDFEQAHYDQVIASLLGTSPSASGFLLQEIEKQAGEKE